MSEHVVRILVADNAGRATAAVQLLRDTGYVTHTRPIGDLDALSTALALGEWELLLVSHDAAPLDVPQIMEAMGGHVPAPPVVVLETGKDPERARELVRAGAVDVLGPDQLFRLIPIIMREAARHDERAAYAELERAVHVLQERQRRTLCGLRDALCITQDGVHVDANQAYLELFGYDSFAAIADIPVLNLIDKRDHAAFKECLRQPEKCRTPVELRGIRADGTRIPIAVAVSETRFDGQTYVELTVTSRAIDQPNAIDDDTISAGELRAAVHRQHIEFLFQPVVNLHGQPEEFYEALPWIVVTEDRHVPVGDCLAVARRAGLTRALYDAMFARLLHRLHELRQQGREIAFLIEVSGEAFDDEDIIAALQEKIWGSGLKPGQLVLGAPGVDITTRLRNDAAGLRALITMGVRFAVADFGRTLNILKPLHIDAVGFLAIDPDVVDALSEDRLSQSILNAVIQIARAMDKRTMVRNVNDPSRLTHLWRFNIDYIQGDALCQAGTDLDYNFSGDVTLESGSTSRDEDRPASHH